MDLSPGTRTQASVFSVNFEHQTSVTGKPVLLHFQEGPCRGWMAVVRNSGDRLSPYYPLRPFCFIFRLRLENLFFQNRPVCFFPSRE